ncbi:MAG: hypothetical protein IJS67_05150 [Clostridia bacterium]|nr:hypothetical protein [Clostridia bacterium]
MFEKLKKLKIIKFEYIVVILLCFAVLLTVYFTFGSNAESSSGATETERYIASLERKLENALSKAKGAEGVSVVITVESGIKTEIAQDVKTVNDNGKITTTSTPITVSGKPLVLRELYPEITGVVIVAKGADNITVKMSLLDAATTVLGVSCDKIQILSQ